MTWNEIQTKWASMARRVRSDLHHDDGEALTPITGTSSLPGIPPDQRAPTRLDRSDA